MLNAEYRPGRLFEHSAIQYRARSILIGMPSPIGHALGGIAAGWAIAPVKNARNAVLLAGAGAAADLDLLVGTHRGPTHSLGAAVLMYFVVQTQLLSQVDKSLADAAVNAQNQGPRGNDRGGRPPFGDPGQTVSGRGDVFAQSIDSSGRVIRADYNQPVAALVTL